MRRNFNNAWKALKSIYEKTVIKPRSYDTVLPPEILRRYRQPQLRVPRWIMRSLVPVGIGLIGLAIICFLAFIVPPKPDPRLMEIAKRALAHVGVTPPQISATIGKAPRATLVKLPDDNWNNVCTP